MMNYGYNLSAISLDDFAELMDKSYLIPSMRVLLDGIDNKFSLIKEQGITTMEDLYIQTKTKKKAEQLAAVTGIDVEYMIVLRRMVSSYIPKPRKLEDYPDMDDELVSRLRLLGIKNSIGLDAYMKVKTIEELKQDLGLEQPAKRIP